MRKIGFSGCILVHVDGRPPRSPVFFYADTLPEIAEKAVANGAYYVSECGYTVTAECWRVETCATCDGTGRGPRGGVCRACKGRDPVLTTRL